ncbi:MarR family winged helix-turn-helix transcriptional regulator [Pontibacillus salipaludis]|uniref:HTH-type transcriptional regulator SarZ n=1 Tax=Pontibacillus salipaludis TaxID=1697394 RepID=A0ABQ1Q5H7_9BACI|nr:MarR family transcriptional regulator [Pontibacillus salipaludis]GGD14485.1 organic hydroperoxide resistance transcriptional regulator [Pontibacillus salipaludis]
MAEDHLKLENQICFSIYATAREVTKLYKPLLEELNVTYPQYLALLVLWEEDCITVKEMGHRLYLDSGTLTPMLKRMETAGLLFRERSKHDERSVVVCLTEQGKEAEQTADSIPYQLLDQLNMDAEELKQFKASMMKVLNSVHQKNES